MSGVALVPLAHVGHWWTYVLYAIPVVIVLTSVALTVIRERRSDRRDDR